MVFGVIGSSVKGPEFPIVAWSWWSVDNCNLYRVGFCVAPKRPQVFVVLRVILFIVLRVFWVIEFKNFYPLFSLQNSIFVNKNLLKTKIPVLLAPAIKESTLEKARERVKHVIRSQKIGGTPKQTKR